MTRVSPECCVCDHCLHLDCCSVQLVAARSTVSDWFVKRKYKDSSNEEYRQALLGVVHMADKVLSSNTPLVTDRKVACSSLCK